MANRRAKYTGGFTLIEIMVAITLLTIILAIVYGTFSSVVMSIERTRAASERMKTTAFIARGFSQNLSQASECWLPGAASRPYSAPAAAASTPSQSSTSTTAAPANHGLIRSQFKGSTERGPNGPADTLSFASSAPMPGGGTLPGQLKMCTYKLEEDKTGNGEDPAAAKSDKKPRMLLVITETPWTPADAASTQSAAGIKPGALTVTKVARDTLSAAASQQPVTRSVPIYGLDLAYYDGKKWVEAWDSQDSGRLPWSVRVRVKLDQLEGEEGGGANTLDPEKDKSVLELYFDVPAGEGTYDAPPSYVRPSARSGNPGS